jgi:hypothetical protein
LTSSVALAFDGAGGSRLMITSVWPSGTFEPALLWLDT